MFRHTVPVAISAAKVELGVRGKLHDMQPRAFIAALIFLASYLPLAMILAIQDVDSARFQWSLCSDWAGAIQSCATPLKHPWLATLPLIVCATCLVITRFMLASVRPSSPIKIKSAKPVPADLMNYTLPYIVSFMSLDFADIPKLTGFALLLGWLFLITLRSGQLLMNPVLTLFGWRLYEITFVYQGGTTTERERLAMVQGSLEPDTTVMHDTIQDILVVKGDRLMAELDDLKAFDIAGAAVNVWTFKKSAPKGLPPVFTGHWISVDEALAAALRSP